MDEETRRRLRTHAATLLNTAREITTLDTLHVALALTKLNEAEMAVIVKFIDHAQNPVEADLTDLFMQLVVAAKPRTPQPDAPQEQ